MDALPFRVISSQNQYRDYCEKLADLVKQKRKTRIDLDSIELLKLLVSRWDENQRPLSDSSPVEFIRDLMRQNNVKAKDLAAEVGISKSHLSDILHYRRRLSRELIRKLASRFTVPQELLNKPYNSTPARSGIKAAAPVRRDPSLAIKLSKQRDEVLVRVLNERLGTATTAKLRDNRELTIWNFMYGRGIYDPCGYVIANVKPKVDGVATAFLLTSNIKELIDPVSKQTIFVEKD